MSTFGIIGVIYPVPTNIVYRLFDGKTKIFVKFLVHNSTKLAPNHKILFYASQGLKKIVGEGIIEKVEFLTPEKVISKYNEQLFLNESEFFAYINRSSRRTPSKEMLTLKLKKLKKYPKPIEYEKPITMAGQYLSAEEYSTLIHKWE